MKSEWQNYPRDRKIRYEKNYVVVVPSSYDEKNERSMLLFCEVCDIRFGHREDDAAYVKFGCCSSCADTWAYSNKEKWENGWRPSQDEIKRAVEKRSFIDPYIVFE